MTDFPEITPAELDAEQAELVAAARGALAQSYAPYSGVRVGAALRTPDGEIISAANIENSAFGSTLCAERAALAAAYARGARDFSGLAIVAAASSQDNSLLVAPCGACRQMLHEAAQVSNTPLQVIFSSPSGDRFVVTDMDALLPLAFGPEHLPQQARRAKKDPP